MEDLQIVQIDIVFFFFFFLLLLLLLFTCPWNWWGRESKKIRQKYNSKVRTPNQDLKKVGKNQTQNRLKDLLEEDRQSPYLTWTKINIVFLIKGTQSLHWLFQPAEYHNWESRVFFVFVLFCFVLFFFNLWKCKCNFCLQVWCRKILTSHKVRSPPPPPGTPISNGLGCKAHTSKGWAFGENTISKNEGSLGEKPNFGSKLGGIEWECYFWYFSECFKSRNLKKKS